MNITTPAETPAHLRPAADKEIARLIRAGTIEPWEHPTEWSSRGFFVKKGAKEGEETKVQLVTDFTHLNKILKRPGYPNEGSSQLVKRIPANSQYFAVFDLTSGFHQVYLPEEYRSLFAIVLQNGKFRFKVLPQGTNLSPDLFNLVTDGELRDKEWILKNMDDLLVVASSYEELCERIMYVIGICKKKNIKLSPKKMQVGREVIFRGININNDTILDSVNLTPGEAKLETLQSLTVPKNKKNLLKAY